MTLNAQQKKLLFKILASRKEDPLYLEGLGSDKFPESKVDQICAWINDEFMMHGLSDDNRPNSYGVTLEELLDAVNRRRVMQG